MRDMRSGKTEHKAIAGFAYNDIINQVTQAGSCKRSGNHTYDCTVVIKYRNGGNNNQFIVGTRQRRF